MREIVYFWISEFRNIKNQGFNLGSEYEYYTEVKDDTFIIKRKINEYFIKDFFHTENSDSIINVSAIVGENGSGKSNFLDAFKHVLSGDRDSFDYLIIFKNEDGSVFISGDNELKINCDFCVSYGSAAFTEVIYYNPALENKIYPITHDNNAWIDISTDWLIFKDSEEQRRTRPSISQIELFGAQEIERQLKLSNDSEFTNFLEGVINVPSEVRIVSVAGEFPSKIDNSNTSNVPFSYRKYYDLLSHIGGVSRDYIERENSIQVERIIPDEENPFTRKKCFATFLDHLLKNLFYHFESSAGDYLDKGNIKVKISELEKLSYEEAIYKFIENIDLIDDTNVIIDFIEYTKELILDAKVEFSRYGYISWISPKEKLNKFLQLKDAYLDQLTFLLDYDSPRSFINYSWTVLSTGERALFNLFSRFYFAKSQIVEIVNSFGNEHKKIPTMLYLLIDEAEMGFHLQWQKEYINNMIEFLPKIFVFDEEEGKVYPKIQIIFTTHSTLALSDIPNSHITYLKQHDGKAKVLANEEKPRKSFGANVHSLMCDSFFLRNGLVGSFAVNKINEVIAILNSDNPSNSSIKKVESVVKIIDEPILKSKLESMLSKFDNNVSEIEKLELMKKNIENRLKVLKKND